MKELISIKNSVDDFEVSFDVLTPVEFTNNKYSDDIFQIEKKIKEKQEKIDEINSKIDNLTNHADGIDYTIAVTSGIIAGLIDSFFVGEFSIDRANEWGNKKVDNFVMKIAKAKGYNGEDDLSKAVKFLEDKYPIPADSATNIFGGGTQHHLRDFSHHPTPLGLFFSLLTQFFKKVYGTDVTGKFIVKDVPDLTLIGKDVPQKLLFGVVHWFFHMVSDMAGSSDSIRNGSLGTGLPGPLISLLKEISALPFFKNLNKDGNRKFSVWISKLFNGTLLAKKDENGKISERVKFDLRTEIGVAHELGRQAIPVLINECIVRGFYFIRRFFTEIKQKNIRSIHELNKIAFCNVLPCKNRTIIRMLTISTGTFVAVDMADAAIHSTIKSGGFNPAFLSNFVLRVNFIGVGRFAIAVGTDVGMGIKRESLRNERIALYNEMILLTNAKVFYKQSNLLEMQANNFNKMKEVWQSANDATETLNNAMLSLEKSINFFIDSLQEIKEDIKKIEDYVPKIEEKNPSLVNKLLEIMTWGDILNE